MKAARDKQLIAGNWKMNLVPSEASRWLRDLLAALEARGGSPRGELLICPPFTHLPAMAERAFGTPVVLGAQDVSAHEAGARTGEVSAAMLADIGVRYVIVGHSERRTYHLEDDATVAAKAAAALAVGLTPIVCVGENREQRDAGNAVEVVLEQLTGSLAEVALTDAQALVVAYEPVWAIGTGLTATSSDAEEVAKAIRSRLEGLFPSVGEGVRVLYGGSMNAGNAAELLSEPNVDGGLIGGASLKVEDLLTIDSHARAVAP